MKLALLLERRLGALPGLLVAALPGLLLAVLPSAATVRTGPTAVGATEILALIEDLRHHYLPCSHSSYHAVIQRC